jgi:hypothetical protein
MQVEAKCIMDAWDSIACLPYKPGQGPLPGGLYKIDRDGPLAKLKTPRGKYVFEFDRNSGPADKPHDYSCKKEGCGKKFKTLPKLGRHTNSAHKDDPNPMADDEEAVILKTSTCKQCDPPQVFDSRGAMMKHKGEVHGAAFFQKGFGKQKVEAEAIPA